MNPMLMPRQVRLLLEDATVGFTESLQGASATPTGHEPERAAAFRSAGFTPQGWSLGTLLRTEVRAPAGGRFRGRIWRLLLGWTLVGSTVLAGDPVAVTVENASLDGTFDGEKARLVIEANLGGLVGREEPALYGVALAETVRVKPDRVAYEFEVQIDAVRGELREIVLPMTGDGEVTSVVGEGLVDWGVRREGEGRRSLVIRLPAEGKGATRWTGQVAGEQALSELPTTTRALSLTALQPALANGFVLVEGDPTLAVEVASPAGVVPVEDEFLPATMRAPPGQVSGDRRGFRFLGAAYDLPLRIRLADPEARQVVVRDFELRGRLADDAATFELTATAIVKNPRGGRLELLAGEVALGQPVSTPDWRLRFENGGYFAEFAGPGKHPIHLKFYATVASSNGWNRIQFKVATGALAPVSLEGLGSDTEMEVAGAARPEVQDGHWRTFLPSDGRLTLGWRPARPEAEGRLFFAGEEVTQVGVSPGLLRVTSAYELKVMQGDLNQIVLRLRGAGEVTRVQGPQVLSWEVAPVPNTTDRRLTVQFNQPQRGQASVQVQLQQALGAFPLTLEVPRLEPEGATRLAGQVRIVNEGAVRLEVVQANGLSQISPEQFVQTELTRSLLPAQANQVFAYRYAGTGAALQVRADNILPELAVSEVLIYSLGESELAIDGELEVDVREAPLRELLFRIPSGYGVARLQVPGLADYFVTEGGEGQGARLRAVYGSPVIGRQAVQLRLERNEPLTGARWELPRVEVEKAKSVRGHVGVVAEEGFRISPAVTQGVTEVATAFFPKRVTGLQLGLRISEPAWSTTLSVERLAPSVQADAFHLFSVAEGIAYGSSLINYVVSGAPVSTFLVTLSGEYANVEFTGKNIRSWQKTDGGYEVQLHTPATGTYALLATYERPFRPRGETLAFVGAQPQNVQSEQGYTLVISTYQFRVEPVAVSSSLTPLEPGEVPAEYRLFFDAPILVAYRYSARPFDLQLALTPFAQGDVVSQVIDRASLTTRVSEEGQVVTEGRYFVKNKGAPNLRLRLPIGAELWSVLVDGKAVVPVRDGDANLVPLPHRADPDEVTELQVKIASRSASARRLTVEAPRVGAPVLLAEWRMEPAAGRRLVYRRGTLSPAQGWLDPSGFAGLTRLLEGPEGGRVLGALAVACVAALIGLWVGKGILGGRGRRFGIGHLFSGLVCLAAVAVAIVSLLQARSLAVSGRVALPVGLHFVAPVQQADVAWQVTVNNWSTDAWTLSGWGSGLLALLALVAWGYAFLVETTGSRRAATALGWALAAWAVLRLENGAPMFFLVLLAFVLWHLLLPALRGWWAGAGPASVSPAAVAAGWVALAGLGVVVGGGRAEAAMAGREVHQAIGVADSVAHEIRVEGDRVLGTARIRWSAEAGQVLPVLDLPGVMIRSGHPTNQARLLQLTEDGRRRQVVVAEASGVMEFPVDYETRADGGGDARGFELPVPAGLVQRARVTVQGMDVALASPHAAAVIAEEPGDGTNTVATLVLAPVDNPRIVWTPRRRDTRRERPVYFAEWAHLQVPVPGVVDGLHEVQVRPAQGELSELVFRIPSGATVTDVTSPALAFWRFDPDSGRLRVSLSPAQSRTFSLVLKSQVTTGPLPYTREMGLPSLEGAAGQVGMVGVATGGEVQLDDVRVEGFSAINLEDYPAGPVEALRSQVSGLTVRRAFRHGDTEGRLTLVASAVEPDVRVESQQTLSLGEDRIVLAATLEAEVIRAGIFRLSFPLPEGLEVEAASGPALSHWTELRSNEVRVVTLHLKGKTLGRQQFNLTLVGAGVRTTNGWVVPRLALREATKQRGQLLVVPEQGLRLQVVRREGVTQLDPAQAGVRQKGVLAFRMLQDPWVLALDLEQVDAWIQVTGLQHVTFAEAQVRVVANLQYEIENTGVKALVVRLPATAEGVRFAGEAVGDYLAPPAGAAETRDWEVKLDRRIIGAYRLQVSHTLPLTEQATDVAIDGVQAQGVNLQRGFVTLQAGGRLQVRAEAPASLQPAEWQSIPRVLQQDLTAPSASYAFRLVEPAFRLPVQLVRHEAARLLPARVQSVDLHSVIADDGATLTWVRLHLVPGDKRLLHLILPDEARFWFAFVNENSVWPWQSTNQVLLPLEGSARREEAATVEFFYSDTSGRAGGRSLSVNLRGPKFDLPLEDISWEVYLNEKWRVRDWSGTLQFRDDDVEVRPEVLDLESYKQNEVQVRQEKTKEAEGFLNLANSLLQQGDPEKARRAFQAAYGMSQHDQAFNEDARVQLNNLRVQQALVGLNFRQARLAGENEALAAAPRGLRDNRATTYTQAEARQLLERNTAEDSAIQARLAERFIQQQDAAVVNPAAIRVSPPEQGRRLTFTRPLDVNTWSDLHIGLEASAARTVSFTGKVGMLLALFAGVVVLLSLAHRRTQREASR